MASHRMPPGTKTIGINMKLEVVNDLEKRAESMDIGVSKYCKIILSRWLDSGELLNVKEK